MGPAVIKGLFDLGTGLASVGGSLWSNSQNRRSQENENARNRAYSREQNRLNLEQWQRENVYNSPFAQMQRLRAAGINPAMAYSDGIENLAAQSPEMIASQSKAYTGTPNPFSSFVDDYSTMSQLRATIENINADTEYKRAKSGESAIVRALYEQKLEIDGTKFTWDKEDRELDKERNITELNLVRERYETQKEETRKVAQQVRNLSKEYDIKELEREFLELTKDDRVMSIKLNNSELRSKIRLNGQTYELNEFVKKERVARVNAISSYNDKILSQFLREASNGAINFDSMDESGKSMLRAVYGEDFFHNQQLQNEAYLDALACELVYGNAQHIQLENTYYGIQQLSNLISSYSKVRGSLGKRNGGFKSRK